MKTHSNLAVVTFVVGTALSIGAMIQSWAYHKADEQKSEQERAEARNTATAQRELAASNRDIALITSIDRYNACNGNVACQSLYRLAKNAIESANKSAEKTATGTGSPEHRVENGDIVKMPIMTISPRPGSGGSGGELVPIEDQLVKAQLSNQFASKFDWTRRTDPEAARTFCTKVVNDYKVFSIGKVTGAGRPVETTPSNSSAPIPTSAFGVAQFDKWTPSYWAEQKCIYLPDPNNRAAENNCQAMDEVQGL